MWRQSYSRGAQPQICPATGSITAAREPRGRILLRVICVRMMCSVHHILLRVAFQRDIPSPWQECWSANGEQINVCVIHSHMGALLHVPVRSWQWITECRLNKDGENWGALKHRSSLKQSLTCAGYRRGCGEDQFGSAPSPKPRWCKRSRVLSKWSPADCWPLCLFPSIMLRVWERVCARVPVGRWGVPACMPPAHWVVRVQGRGLWRICLCCRVAWMSNLSGSYSPGPGSSPPHGDRKAVALWVTWHCSGTGMCLRRRYSSIFCQLQSCSGYAKCKSR